MSNELTKLKELLVEKSEELSKEADKLNDYIPRDQLVKSAMLNRAIVYSEIANMILEAR